MVVWFFFSRVLENSTESPDDVSVWSRVDGVTLVNQETKSEQSGVPRDLVVRPRRHEKQTTTELERKKESDEGILPPSSFSGRAKRSAVCGPRFSYLSFPDAYVLLGRAMPRRGTR